ncbi:nickel pincer cofactor biosynthesis protein LarB [Butyrivibrio sp. CB08]|uniref:nickel pincer cofactor biosynthesis protein LarB n=1 Tax=Butyrivibrio sp. CB08 TaxID=2364879 RepID=UPI000EA95D68|nr:nickel pincer cofactor biosynthesis protein LarB [Butyrivibrio sp. CB08]RKM61237.1 nickel pincer cofactor biosynthesis protein LarB [Butyrivibrio sp. CB08]
MEEKDLRDLLDKVKSGDATIEEALLKLKEAPYEDMGFAKPDLHRGLRQGKPEVIYGQGKTPEQIVKISEMLLSHGQKKVLITRMSQEAATYYECNRSELTKELFYDELSKVGIAFGEKADEADDKVGKIVIATGGTSDMPVAEEAALTAEFYGNNVVRLYDVGVAGIHRLMSKEPMEEIMTANVVIAIAGMEGALASVVGGLADCPVIAVPTSVGYGASFGGLSALLSMLNSCASGVSVVNIDNGFGAGFLASMINQK